MVEFGLKLEDNRVADWSDHYIEYEKLKGILKKYQAAQGRWNDLAAKNPETAAAISDSFDAGVSTPYASKEDLQAYEQRLLAGSTSPGASTSASNSAATITAGSSLQKSASFRASKQPQLDFIKEESIREERETEITERTELVPAPTPSQREYGSADDTNGSSHGIRFALGKAASGVTDYFAKGYERQARDTLKELEKYNLEFDECLVKSHNRVNAFYKTRLAELNVQLLVLKESVAGSRSPPAPAPPSMDASLQAPGQQQQQPQQQIQPPDVENDAEHADELETPLVRNRKKHRPSLVFVQEVAIKVARVSGVFKGKDMRRSTTVHQAVPSFDDDYDDTDDHPDKEQRARKIKEADSIQRSLVDLYRTAKLLHNFAILNYTGFVKIVKKHDKSIPRSKGRYKQLIAPVNVCNEGKAVEALADRMELLYANWFCDRNMSEARAQMLPKKEDGLGMDWSQLRLGYRMGMCSILGLWVCWDCVWGLLSTGKSTIGGRTAFPVFRATGGLLVLQWFWGCSVWVWTRYRINYIYLFDFNPQIVESPLAIFNRAVDNTLFFLVNMLLYYKAGAHDVPGNFPAGIFPFAVVVYTCHRLIFPLRIRVPMWQAIWEVVTAGMNSPSFFHGYVGDIFTSMVKVFQDMLWTICFVFSGDWLISEDLAASTKHQWSRTNTYAHILIPLLTLLPLWFRFNQCLRRYADTGNRVPHLPNAFKYALSQTVTLFGAFHPLYLGIAQQNSGFDLFQFFWVAVFVSSSLYSFFWDVYMDWGLGRPKFGFLGPRLMYPEKYFYFVIIVFDLVLRFAWVLTLVPPESGASFALPQYMTAVSLMLELFRRTIWGFLRLENEHRSKASSFGRVGFVPLHFSTGHMHEYNQEKEHRGFSVLVEVAVVTLVVLGACTVSVVMAQQATERLNHLEQARERINHLDL